MFWGATYLYISLYIFVASKNTESPSPKNKSLFSPLRHTRPTCCNVIGQLVCLLMNEGESALESIYKKSVGGSKIFNTHNQRSPRFSSHTNFYFIFSKGHFSFAFPLHHTIIYLLIYFFTEIALYGIFKKGVGGIWQNPPHSIK